MKVIFLIILCAVVLCCQRGKKKTPGRPDASGYNELINEFESNNVPNPSPTQSHSRVPLIPRKTLLGNPEYSHVRLSPDGHSLAYLAPSEGLPVLNIWVWHLPDGKPKQLTFDIHRGIRSFTWSYSPALLIYGQDNDGDENLRLYSVNVDSRERKLLTSSTGAFPEVWASSYRHPDDVIIGMHDEEQKAFGFYSLNLKSSHKTLLFRESGLKNCYFDKDLKVRLVSNATENGGMTYYKATLGNEVDSGLQLTHWKDVSRDDYLLTEPLHFDDTGSVLYWFDSTGRDKVALIEENFDTGDNTTILKPEAADLRDLFAHPQSGRPLWVIEDHEKPAHILLNESLAADFDLFKRTFPGMQIISTSLNLETWLIVMATDRHSPKYYLYNRSERDIRGSDALKPLFSLDSKLDTLTLARMHPVEIVVRDGLTQVCYLSLPPESSTPLPMVLSVHGGPWLRDIWNLNRETQLWANRGYAVLQCNFRGSKGYGKKFLNAGNGEWGRKMQHDLTDAVNWAIDVEIADPDRVAIVGVSYGGYAALAGLSFTPNLYACGIDVVGPSNLVSFLKSLPAQYKQEYENLKYRLGGDPDTDPGRRFLASISPLFAADKINKPLLIAHGSNDPRVQKSESDLIVAELYRHSIPVTYLVFPDEGHGFVRPSNRLAYFAVAEHFLAKCLGGRAEPIENAVLKASSIQIKDRGGFR